MSDKRYVLGVDGGNSKTDYALFLSDGTFVDGIRSGTCSHENFQSPGMSGFAQAGRVMNECITALLSQNGLTVSDISSAAFGLAGDDFEFQHKKLHDELVAIGFKNFKHSNDAILGIKGEAKRGTGVCSINGTGTVTKGVDPTGNSLQIGGIGHFFGDEAGGAFIAGRAISIAYNYFFRCAEKTLLAEKLLRLFGLEDNDNGKRLLSERYIYRETDAIKNIDIINAFYDAAMEGDEPCIAALQRIGEQLALSVVGCIRNLNFESEDEIDVILAGSVWIKSKCPIIFDSFKEKLGALTDKKINLIKFQTPPVGGAILWALEIENKTFPNEDLRLHVLRQIYDAPMFK